MFNHATDNARCQKLCFWQNIYFVSSAYNLTETVLLLVICTMMVWRYMVVKYLLEIKKIESGILEM